MEHLNVKLNLEGARRVIDLHGRLDRVECLGCGGLSSRKSFQERLEEENPAHLGHQTLGMTLDEAIENCEERPAAYVLCPEKESYLYKGSCRKLSKRMRDHRAGRVSRTKNRRPLRLVYFEYCQDFSEARKRENFLKSGAGRAFLVDRLSD